MWLDLAGHHVLVGGEPGAGKSNALSMIVATAALDPSVDLWCLDAKLVELAPWRELAQAFVGPDIAEATIALGVLQTEMTNRYEWLLEQKLRKVTPDTGLGLVLVVIVLVGRDRIGGGNAALRAAISRLGARLVRRPAALGSAAPDGH